MESNLGERRLQRANLVFPTACQFVRRTGHRRQEAGAYHPSGGDDKHKEPGGASKSRLKPLSPSPML
jgi:hypothetical protein